MLLSKRLAILSIKQQIAYLSDIVSTAEILDEIRPPIQIEPGHTGFCLGDYDKDICKDCPSLIECLELRIRELEQEI